MKDESISELAPFLEQLSVAKDAERAVSIARLLLEYAFGQKFGLTFCEYPERAFPVADWTQGQRLVLEAIARCDAVWPAIGGVLQLALEVDFRPEQEELKNALNGKQVERQLEAEYRSPTDFSQESVVAAVVRLYESFAIKRRNLESALKEFEPYRPYSACGIPFLIEKLNGETKAESESAAWALGRMGEFAVDAVPALIQKMNGETGNLYAGLALENIPLVAETYEFLCDRLEQSTHTCDLHQYMRIIGDNISTERLKRWVSHPEGDMRYWALRMLGNRVPSEMKSMLLSALADPDENVNRQATYILTRPEADTASWYFSELSELDEVRRYAIADAFRSERVDLSLHKRALFELLRTSEDLALVEILVSTVGFFGNKESQDLHALVEIRNRFDSVSFSAELIRTIRHLHGNGFDEMLVDSLALFLGDPNAFVRGLAIEKIGCFTNPEARVVELLRGALRDRAESVQLKAMWHLYYRGSQSITDLLDELESCDSDRVSAELIWALGMFKQERQQIRAVLETLEFGERPLTGNAVQWFMAQGGQRGC